MAVTNKARSQRAAADAKRATVLLGEVEARAAQAAYDAKQAEKVQAELNVTVAVKGHVQFSVTISSDGDD